MDNEDPEAFGILLEFLGRIETNLNYVKKQEYIALAEDFLTDQITADDFSSFFTYMYHEVSKKARQMQEKESLELANLLKPNRTGLSRLLANLDWACNSYSPDPEISLADEKELKDYAQKLIFQLQVIEIEY